MFNDPATPSSPDSSESTIGWEALARYLAGESSADESARIAKWLEEHKADAEMLAALDNAMAVLALRDASDVDVEAALNNVAARRDRPRVPDSATVHRPARARVLPRRTVSAWRAVTFLGAAAAVLIAARLLLQTRNGGDSGISPNMTNGLRYATGVGKRDSVRLPDGGRVVLGPASRLVVAAGYAQRVREVELHGEGYFEVVHDTTRPFVVRVGDAVVRDVGTSFAVRGDSGIQVQVAVISGSVAVWRNVGSDTGAVVLGAGDVGALQASGKVAVRHDVSTAQYLAWMRDSLVFREAPLREVSNDLRRWYGIVLRVDDSTLAQRHLTMTFAGDPLDRVLRVIGLGLGADIERRGDTAIVRATSSTGRSTRPQ